MKTTIKRISIIMLLLISLCTCSGCASCSRAWVDIKSDMGNGLPRIIKIYTANGDIIAEYEGKIDLEQEANYIKFDFEGKRYIYYNCFVETIADI